MLIRDQDAGIGDAEWQDFVQSHDFGQLAACGKNREIPVIVPTHFVFKPPTRVILHLAKDNPVWEALSENPMAVMSVVGAYTYIPSDVNGGRSEPTNYGVPTSYYGAVQLIGNCTILDGHDLTEILNSQLAHFEPDGHYAEVETGDNPYGRQLKGIRGLLIEVIEVRSKFKFGNNKTVDHRMRIADWLSQNGDENSSEARTHLIRRMKTTETTKEASAGNG